MSCTGVGGGSGVFESCAILMKILRNLCGGADDDGRRPTIRPLNSMSVLVIFVVVDPAFTSEQC